MFIQVPEQNSVEIITIFDELNIAPLETAETANKIQQIVNGLLADMILRDHGLYLKELHALHRAYQRNPLIKKALDNERFNNKPSKITDYFTQMRLVHITLPQDNDIRGKDKTHWRYTTSNIRL